MIKDNYNCNNMPMCEPWQLQEQAKHFPMANLSHQQQGEEADKWALTGIAYPGKHDVMLGRGGESNYHTGNLTFRSFIQEHKIRYQKARKQEKPIIALEVVLAWRDLSPPGRFLARIDPSRADSLWEDVGDDQACKRAGRTLGEKCSGKAKQQQQDKKARPSPKIVGSSADAVSPMAVALSAMCSKGKTKPQRGKRPQACLDFIASFNSRQIAAGAPAAKKRRTTASGAGRDFISSLVAQQKPERGDSHLKMVASTQDLANSIFWDDRQKFAMRESIPTAEFLTRTAFWDD